MRWRRFELPFLGGLVLAVLMAGAIVMRPPAAQHVAAAESLAALPPGWPSTLQLGVADSPGGAAAVKAKTNFGFRYQYLAGGVNTGNGWATWNANGDFVRYYVQDSVANGITPVFTYYQIFQSSPGNGQGELAGVTGNLQNTSTMAAYWKDLKLFFQRAAGPDMVVLHVEPDMWGYTQQKSTNDDAATVAAAVSSTSMAELAGLPNNMSGFAQAVVKLRDLYAPNVKLGYHLSYWGTGTDPLYSKPSDSEIDSLATRSANYYKSLGTKFDISFAEFSDRDAAFYQYQYGNANAWWQAADFARNVRYLSKYSTLSGTRIVMWQIPLGNTKMRAMNNTWGHYQDNRPEWLLDDAARTHLTEYANAGVVAFLFGGGAGGVTCACDANNDGTTNPAPINGNDQMSLSADDDGGYFNAKAKAYYAAGAMALGSGSAPAPTATPTKTASATATPTKTASATATPTKTPSPTATPGTPAPTATPAPTNTAVPQEGWTSRVKPSTTSVRRGSGITLSTTVTSGTTTRALVDIEVYDPRGRRVFQSFYDNRSFVAGVPQTLAPQWRVPSNAARGTYTVMVGVFSTGWGTVYDWNASAGTFTVR